MITMSKEMELLKSKMEFYKSLINHLDYLNYIEKRKDYSRCIEHYQNILSELNKRVQELKENK